MVLLEAMIAGVPVISTDVGGAPEVVGDCGVLIELGGIESLSRVLAAMYRGKQSYTMIERAISQFDDSSVKMLFNDICLKSVEGEKS
jgi:glycosyltransferase involved in cell wall biosynthesis